MRRAGRLSLWGLAPLLKAEIKWGLFCHTQRRNRTSWRLPFITALLDSCRGLRSLDDLDTTDASWQVQMIAQEMRRDLQTVYATPSDTRETGYIDLEHFGRSVRLLDPKFDLSVVRQRWLRDLLWHFLAAQLSSVDSPRSRNYFYNARVACHELSAFLDAHGPQGGHDPALLTEQHIAQFIADQRRRARDRLPSLRPTPAGTAATVTEAVQATTFDVLRRLFRWAAETGHDIGLVRAVYWAFPAAGRRPRRPRNPFPDHVARALADETNLQRLAETDTTDRGLRDIWETIIVTGRRAGEILGLRLDCTGIYNGVPLLWHDQTKVDKYDEAIRIPEYIHQRLEARRQTTLDRFVARWGRPPNVDERADVVLFPRSQVNPLFDHAVGYVWFHSRFKDWVTSLNLGPAVPHQARHTLATKLLAAGANLQQVKRYLGHVSERMTEHYAKVALRDIDEILKHVWVSGPGAPNPGELLSGGVTPLTREQAQALVIDLTRRSTPAEGGLCTFQVVVDGGACPWNLDCEHCEKFVISGADLLYWRRKREQWYSLAERSPTDEMADWLHKVFEPTARAIDGLEKALAGLGLLEDALALDLRRPQDYFDRLWRLGFRTTDLTAAATGTEPS